MRQVRGDLTEGRLELVKKAFKVLDRDGSGVVDYRDICETYNASKHPAVIEGRKTERQVLEEFLQTFEAHQADKPDGQVTLEEFTEYYTSVSASIDDDAYFYQMMNNSWNIDGAAQTYQKHQKAWAGEQGSDQPVVNKKGPGVYSGFQKEHTGKATCYSGVQSADNPFGNMTQYYAGREQAQRKSIAYDISGVKNKGFKETPGQESSTFYMRDERIGQKYDQHIQRTQKPLQHAVFSQS